MSDAKDFFAAVDQMSAYESLDEAAMRHIYRIERVGETFYQQVAARIHNEDAAALLLKNAREERGHAERMRRAVSLKLGREWVPTDADAAPYPIPLPEKIDASFLPGIVAGELEGDVGYQRWADREPNPEIQKL